MQTTPKSMRLQIGIFGRTNVGKSSFLNMVAGQDVAITSPVPGTTTDVVEKPMELLPVGPVVFLDTAGVDDVSVLSAERIKRASLVFDRADVFVLITADGVWEEYEEMICQQAKKRSLAVIVVCNKIDLGHPTEMFCQKVKEAGAEIVLCSSVEMQKREEYVTNFKSTLIESLPEEHFRPPAIIGDLVPPGGLAVLIVPIDLQAPKGRLILPQVQTIRDALDSDAAVMVVKEREYLSALSLLSGKPDLVVCDSQVVQKMVADTPKDVPCTTFSILFARLKGDLVGAAKGAAAIERLKKGDRVLVAESCTHHAAEDDIGRVKIPRWLRQFTGADIAIDVCSGRDYPEDLHNYSLVIHCGGCMITRREMLSRVSKAETKDVPVTNYGVAISHLQGVIKRVLEPFPAALFAYNAERERV